MRAKEFFPEFILKEWLPFASAAALIGVSTYTRHFPRFSRKEFEVIFILAALFVTVKGLEQSGLISRVSRHFEQGRQIPLKLILATFFLSMVITNDVALIVIVPLTLSIDTDRKGILVILEALAANAGSAFTPIGNPQNLYIYWFYNVPIHTFVTTIAPFSMVFLILLALNSLFIKVSPISPTPGERAPFATKRASVYLVLLVILVLTVLRFLPVTAGILVFIYAIVFDKKALNIDYSLLLTFLFFFGITDGLKLVLPAAIQHSGHVFLFSSLTSQLISNVPATLLIAKYTVNWPALLWGANCGGFGSLFASFANLIAFNLYISHNATNNKAAFALKFVLFGYLYFIVAAILYFLLYP